MPTLDDAPLVASVTEATSAGSDLVQLYDVSAQEPKTMTLDELIAYVVANTSATAL